MGKQKTKQIKKEKRAGVVAPQISTVRRDTNKAIPVSMRPAGRPNSNPFGNKTDGNQKGIHLVGKMQATMKLQPFNRSNHA